MPGQPLTVQNLVALAALAATDGCTGAVTSTHERAPPCYVLPILGLSQAVIHQIPVFIGEPPGDRTQDSLIKMWTSIVFADAMIVTTYRNP